MNYHTMGYDEILRIEYGALDLYPIKKFLKKDTEIQTIMHAIEDAIEIEPHELNPKFWTYMKEYEDFFQNDIFNWIAEDEFVKYCENRFPNIKWQHEIVETYTIVSAGDGKCN